ncbi:hypothetical protein GH714_044024 [Hevea brasiliensis]|uniref:Uncharacterized protein n=1 Tax=Hevea brasiliensis TaxID=3981 RepID=A0A6A6K2M1_HEVBR|nr:hypothetical protein GH714_044024 [Hevea brasiliensis]
MARAALSEGLSTTDSRGDHRRGLGFWANRERGAHGRPGSAPHPARGEGVGGNGCVTPRQTCPRPDGFGRNLRSKTRWFAGFCNSHQVSHFAAFFIDARAEISVAESRYGPRRAGGARPSLLPRPFGATGDRRPRGPRVCGRVRGSFCGAGFDNDPSAGSPTETLLRLLLPLNDKVQWTSRDVAGGEPPTSPRSEHFTGPFNR